MVGGLGANPDNKRVTLKVTGERIVTPSGGFNASWQRHAACYALSARFLMGPRILDVGCGLGHAFEHLGTDASIGLDVHHGSLMPQRRQTVAADMRRMPFSTASIDSLVCIHAIEHVPDPQAAVAECARVLTPDGPAVVITPNRLTFGRHDEIIDPYHFIEFDADQLETLCGREFDRVEKYGIFGSERYMRFFDEERRQLNRLLSKDPLRLRRFVPRKLRQQLYDWKLTRARTAEASQAAAEFTIDDFELRSHGLESALDVMTVCHRRRG
ncbi:MAG: class I SAM-dependent methyltransferase [Actinomycetota bacterium]